MKTLPEPAEGHLLHKKTMDNVPWTKNTNKKKKQEARKKLLKARS